MHTFNNVKASYFRHVVDSLHSYQVCRQTTIPGLVILSPYTDLTECRGVEPLQLANEHHPFFEYKLSKTYNGFNKELAGSLFPRIFLEHLIEVESIKAPEMG